MTEEDTVGGVVDLGGEYLPSLWIAAEGCDSPVGWGEEEGFKQPQIKHYNIHSGTPLSRHPSTTDTHDNIKNIMLVPNGFCYRGVPLYSLYQDYTNNKYPQCTFSGFSVGSYINEEEGYLLPT